MSIFTETVGSSSVEVYGGLAAAIDYLTWNVDDGAVAFLGLDSDSQKKRLANATRYLDQQSWAGARTGLVGATPTTLQFPRSGLTDSTGAAVDSTTVPAVVVEAAFEMAAILSGDNSAAQNADQGSNVQSLGAGPANLSFFRPQSVADGNATVLPTVIDRLIGRWLARNAGTVGGFATGVDGRSDFSDTGCSACGSLTGCSCFRGTPTLRWPL
ncbi:MAG TPA: DnaT-like ssDNA-binding protein [Mycobacterium sp.]|nr:DnaT-like ssDNA-binding protein [Mycobacterium sp.]